MAVHNIIFQPWKSYFVTHFAFMTVMVRLIILMQIANIMLLALPTIGQDSVVRTGRVLSQVAGGDMVTTVPRSRCKCHSRALKRGSRAHAQDLSMYRENADEGLQWYLRLSAYISHNQKSGAVIPLFKPDRSQASGEEGDIEQHSGELSRDVNGSRSARRHDSRESIWDDISTDENVRGQILLEQTWSVKWGWCVSHVCDERTCRRATLSVACVGPCRWYRHYSCPKRFGDFCVTSRDYEGCNDRHGKGDGRRGKFHIVNIVQDEDKDNLGGAGHDDDEDDSKSDKKDSDEDVDDVSKEDDDKEAQHGAEGSKSVTSRIGKKCDKGRKLGNPHTQTTHSMLTLPMGGGSGLTQDSGVTEVVIRPVTPSSLDIVPTRYELRQSKVVHSGMRYVWVISCIIIPILVFCVGYAVTLHMRRRRLLQNAQSSCPPTEGASDPFLSTRTAPPYSVEDIFACPRRILSLNFPPPSYEDAMSAPEVSASPDRMYSLSACSEYLGADHQVVASCPAVLSPLMEPPPYVESDPAMAPSSERCGHSRLPSYDSAICLHGSI